MGILARWVEALFFMPNRDDADNKWRKENDIWMQANTIIYNPDRRAEWMAKHGYTDDFKQDCTYWAFPPNAVMAVPLTPQVVKSILEELEDAAR